MKTKPPVVLTIVILAAILFGGCAGQKSVPTPTSQPVPTEQGDATPRITLAENGQTLTYQVGQSFLLFLGEDYTWSLSISDQNVIGRVKNIATIRGSQGVFNALKTSTSVLSAVGDPTCRDQQPACARPSIEFQVTILVQ